MNKHRGQSFDDFLAEDDMLEEVSARAMKKVISAMFAKAFQESEMTKTDLAEAMHTSRKQVNRLLDEEDTGVTLNTIAAAASALDQRLTFRLEPKVKVLQEAQQGYQITKCLVTVRHRMVAGRIVEIKSEQKFPYKNKYCAENRYQMPCDSPKMLKRAGMMGGIWTAN